MKKTSSPPASVTCPTCSTPVKWTAAARWRPFCSERCRLIDLGKWFDESNRIPAEPDQSPEGMTGPQERT